MAKVRIVTDTQLNAALAEVANGPELEAALASKANISDVDATVSTLNALITSLTTMLGQTPGLCIYSGGSYPVRPSGHALVIYIGPAVPSSGAVVGDLFLTTA